MPRKLHYPKKNTARITDLIIRFVEFYRFSHRCFIYDDPLVNSSAREQVINHPYWKDKPEFHQAIAVLNSGDCPVIAMAVGEVLRLDGYDVLYHCNGGHYYFSIKLKAMNRSLAYLYIGDETRLDYGMTSQRMFYDAVNCTGVMDECQMLTPREELVKYRQGDAEWLVECALSDDPLGKEHVEQFVKFYHPKYQYPYNLTKDVIPLVYG